MSSNQNAELPSNSEEPFQPNLLSNEKLAEIIVAHRYLGIMEEQAISAMQELATRRSNGDQFNYEAKIDELMATLPKINLDLAKIFHSFKIPE